MLIWYSTLASFILLKMNYNEDRIENLKKKDFDILIILSFFFQGNLCTCTTYNATAIVP